ncbi:MAG: hypothetical protein EXS05_22170, partial [Planctomycetaceae bacterium]|nr:hypothetical protein [Planctomycetaceae bacterium]
MRQHCWFYLLPLIMGPSAWAEDTPAIPADSPPIVHDIGSRRELFVDQYLIDTLQGGARRMLHRPTPREISLTHDEPWEGNVSGIATIFRDGDIYRM